MPSRWVALLHHHRRTGDVRFAEVVRRTLDRMGDGGLQDHVGGGFQRHTKRGRGAARAAAGGVEALTSSALHQG